VSRIRRLITPTSLVGAILFADMMAFSGLLPLIPELQRRLAASDTAMGALIAGLAFGVAVLGIPMGRLTDKVGPRRITIIAGVLLAISFAGFYWVTTYSGFIIVRLIQGIASAAAWIGGPAWAALGDPSTRTRRLATTSGAGMSGAIFGAGLSGFMASRYGLMSSFILFAAFVGAALALLFLLTSRPELPPSGDLPPFLKSLRNVWSSPKFTVAAALTGMFALIGNAQNTVYTLGLGDRGMSEQGLGLAFLFGGISLAIGQTFIPRLLDRIPPARLLSLVATSFAGLLTLNWAWHTQTSLLITVVLGPALFGGIFGSTLGMLAEGAEEGGSTNAIGITFWSVTWAVGAMIGPVIGGASTEATSERFTIAWLIVLTLTAVPITLTILRPRAAKTDLVPS
jgi:DHA1 family solute carrier family 18 vesicular amine transporter 1/2